MSQRKDALLQVKKLANDLEENLLLRPMSAKLLEPTKPELEGWVDREKLLGISGRNREVQLRLAKEYGFEDYESPGGGCLLTDERFANFLTCKSASFLWLIGLWANTSPVMIKLAPNFGIKAFATLTIFA